MNSLEWQNKLEFMATYKTLAASAIIEINKRWIHWTHPVYCWPCVLIIKEFTSWFFWALGWVVRRVWASLLPINSFLFYRTIIARNRFTHACIPTSTIEMKIVRYMTENYHVEANAPTIITNLHLTNCVSGCEIFYAIEMAFFRNIKSSLFNRHKN